MEILYCIYLVLENPSWVTICHSWIVGAFMKECISSVSSRRGVMSVPTHCLTLDPWWIQSSLFIPSQTLHLCQDIGGSVAIHWWAYSWQEEENDIVHFGKVNQLHKMYHHFNKSLYLLNTNYELATTLSDLQTLFH